jgi:putative membrane protein
MTTTRALRRSRRKLLRRRIDSNDIVKGAVAGVVGGLAASWVMSVFFNVLETLSSKVKEKFETSHASREKDLLEMAERRHERPESVQAAAGEDEPATVKAATMVSEKVFGHEMTECEKAVSGPAVHYAFGGLVGGIYGALAETTPLATTGYGLPYGAAVWALADEVAVPALRLGKPPTQAPLSIHVSALGAHLAYGATLECTRGFVRRLLD